MATTKADAMQGSRFSDFASALRYWRGKRGYSQLELSSISAVSQRHISFLESGRSNPSRELILRLGRTLEIPLRQRNLMLLAAGFAPAYRERSLADAGLGPVRQAIDFMLTQQSPYPALVVDRLWNLQMLNAPALSLMAWLLDLPEDAPAPTAGSVNVLKLMLDPGGAGRFLLNAAEVRDDLLHWIQCEALADGSDSEASRLLSELRLLTQTAAGADTADLEEAALPFLPVQLEKDGIALNLFTTITTLGTPRDVTLHELRLESFFPADEATANWFMSRAQR